MSKDKTSKRFVRRQMRSRYRIRLRAQDRVRLSVFRSSRHIYAQIIDDKASHTLVWASTLEKAADGVRHLGGNCKAAAEVGHRLAERAKISGIEKVVLDRGAYLYHGRVRALAEAAREAGLQF